MNWQLAGKSNDAHDAERIVTEDYLLAIDHLEARLTELDAQLAAIAARTRTANPWRGCAFRGIDTLTAILMLAEPHDFRRFQSPRALMAYLGLVPGEDSSGEKRPRASVVSAARPPNASEFRVR